MLSRNGPRPVASLGLPSTLRFSGLRLLAPGNRAGFAGINENDVKPFRFQHFKGCYSVNTGGLHGDCLDAERDQPIGHAHKIAGKGLEGFGSQRTIRTAALLGRNSTRSLRFASTR